MAIRITTQQVKEVLKTHMQNFLDDATLGTAIKDLLGTDDCEVINVEAKMRYGVYSLDNEDVSPAEKGSLLRTMQE